MQTMPDVLNIANPALRTYAAYRLGNTHLAYDAASSVPHTAYLAAVGYAIEDGDREYLINAVSFIESHNGPRTVLEVWDVEADRFAYYDC